MTRIVLFFAAVFALFSLGAFLAPPWADAHTATVTISSGGCLSNGAWTATYTITPTHLDHNPDATITNVASSFHHSGSWPYTTSAVVDAREDSYTISVHIDWNDDVHYDSGAVTTPRPDDCAPEATTTTSTTTCERAIPPIANCGGVPSSTIPATPTAPVDTTPPSTSPSVDASTSVPVADSPVPTTSPTSGPARTTPPRTPAITSLPTTGRSLLIPVAIGGVIGVLLGLLATLIPVTWRRRS